MKRDIPNSNTIYYRYRRPNPLRVIKKHLKGGVSKEGYNIHDEMKGSAGDA